MNRLTALFWVIVMQATSPAIQGQERDPEPTEPILRRAPAISEWTIRFHDDQADAVGAMINGSPASEESDSPQEGGKQIKSVTVTKDGETYREIRRLNNGRTTEKWIAGELQVYELPSGRIAQAILPMFGYSETYSDFRRSDFEELEWVGMDNYQGVKEMEGTKVFEFRVTASQRRFTPRELRDLADSDGEATMEQLMERYRANVADAPDYTAYLDIETQLPLYFDDGRRVRTYSFSNRPRQRLVVPPRFADELETWRKDLVRHKPLPPP